MTCGEARAKLTAYLDGELEGERGSAVRGHLRTCGACRQAATDEAALRDGLRDLPPVDPPSSLWAGVQARLAQAEMADAERPAWRRALARLVPSRFVGVQLGFAGVAVALAVLLLAWRVRGPEPARIALPAPTPAPAPAPIAAGSDVTDELAAAAASETKGYADTAAELLADVAHERAHWSDDHKQAFDARVAELNKQIAAAADGRPRQKAYRALIRYLQRAAIRDDVALAGGAP
ncbi:MAG TPA: zf-HC2 domain-containing protein [Kofleriaceae bacterium]|nr:zf-HC2 domain-containing protein [Kofleriaceae bacterium]